MSRLTASETLVQLVIATAPELRGVTPDEQAIARAVQLVDERQPTVKGDSVAFAALIDLVAHELTKDGATNG